MEIRKEMRAEFDTSCVYFRRGIEALRSQGREILDCADLLEKQMNALEDKYHRFDHELRDICIRLELPETRKKGR